MDGTIDSYAQMRVFLSEDDMAKLIRGEAVIGRIDRAFQDKLWSWTKLRIYACDEDIPRKDELKPYDKRRGYEIYLSKRRINLIAQGRGVDGESPRRYIRMSCFSKEGVWLA